MSHRKPGHLLWGIYALAVVLLVTYVMAFIGLAYWLRSLKTDPTPTPTPTAAAAPQTL